MLALHLDDVERVNFHTEYSDNIQKITKKVSEMLSLIHWEKFKFRILHGSLSHKYLSSFLNIQDSHNNNCDWSEVIVQVPKSTHLKRFISLSAGIVLASVAPKLMVASVQVTYLAGTQTLCLHQALLLCQLVKNERCGLSRAYYRVWHRRGSKVQISKLI